MSDKPAFPSLAVLEKARQVQRETSRIYAIDYSERTRNRAMVQAAELVAARAIGRVLQTIGPGPHRLNAHTRPDWFFPRARSGGTITRVGAQPAAHFLQLAGSL